MVSDPTVDFWTRLPEDASLEERVEHYQDFIEIEFEERSAILTLRTHAFSPSESEQMLKLVVKESERLVNRVSRALALEQVEFIEGHLKNKEKAYALLRKRIVELQNKMNVLDPMGEATAASTRIAGLEQLLVQEKTKLTSMLKIMDPGSLQISAIQNNIAALEAQLKDQRTELTGTDSEALNAIGEKFREATLEAQLAEQTYALTLQALETAQVEAAQGLKKLVVIVHSELPEEALEPRILFNILTFFGFAVIAYMVGIVMVMVAREHID